MTIVVPILPDAEGKPTIVPINLEKSAPITIEQIQAELDKQSAGMKAWDVNNERNPAYPEGDNRNREAFTYAHYHHPKATVFAGIKSKLLIGAIDFAHKAILKGYDMDAYVFDDPRLKAQNEHFRSYIAANFQQAGYKLEFMNKIVDIIMFLRKEDIYYCRLIDMIETMPRFGLTDAEKNNIERWH